MSSVNGHKARFQVDRKRKLAKRQRTRVLTVAAKPASGQRMHPRPKV